MPEQERIETGDVNLGEIDFYLGLGTQWGFKYQALPPEVGRVIAKARHLSWKNGAWSSEWIELKLVNCGDIVPKDHLDQETKFTFNGYYCIDLQDATLNSYKSASFYGDI